MGCAIGLMSPSSTGPCQGLQWPSKFTRKLVKSSLGGEASALSEMAVHMSSLRELLAPLGVLNPGIVGLEDCESLLTHPKTKKMIAETQLARHFLSTRRPLEESELDNAFWSREPRSRRTARRRCEAIWRPSRGHWILAASTQASCDH